MVNMINEDGSCVSLADARTFAFHQDPYKVAAPLFCPSCAPRPPCNLHIYVDSFFFHTRTASTWQVLRLARLPLAIACSQPFSPSCAAFNGDAVNNIQRYSVNLCGSRLRHHGAFVTLGQVHAVRSVYAYERPVVRALEDHLSGDAAVAASLAAAWHPPHTNRRRTSRSTPSSPAEARVPLLYPSLYPQ
jgi:hypothetical protein